MEEEGLETLQFRAQDTATADAPPPLVDSAPPPPPPLLPPPPLPQLLLLHLLQLEYVSHGADSLRDLRIRENKRRRTKINPG